MTTLFATNAHTVVTLRGGLTVPLAALRLLWDLEGRGFTLRIGADDGCLIVSPHSRLTLAEDQSIRAHRDQLLALVRAHGDIQ